MSLSHSDLTPALNTRLWTKGQMPIASAAMPESVHSRTGEMHARRVLQPVACIAARSHWRRSRRVQDEIELAKPPGIPARVPFEIGIQGGFHPEDCLRSRVWALMVFMLG